MSDNPIGVFDSGIGGLTVTRALEKSLPHEQFIYFGDTARLPYGTKSEQVIRSFALQDSLLLMRFRVKLIVSACNTASAVALDYLQFLFKVPVVGVIEPGTEVAARLTKNKKIGVIGTVATIRKGLYEDYLHKRISDVSVFPVPCPLFVPLVEEGIIKGPLVDMTIAHYLTPLKKAGIDTLILGCTHYPLLKTAIGKFFDSGVSLVDSSEAVASIVSQILNENNLCTEKANHPSTKIFVSDISPGFQEMAERFLGRKVQEINQINPELIHNDFA